MRKALITGAAGFVGQKLAAHLRACGWQTAGCDRPEAAQPAGLLACDVTDAAALDQLLAQAAPLTHVFHLAAITFVPESLDAPEATFDVNLQGTVRLAAAMQKHTPEARLLFIGSSEVYGKPQTLPVDETHPLVPNNPYSIAKAAADHYCRSLSERGQLDIVRLRPFNHSGPGQSPRFVLSSFARQIACIEAGRAEPVLRVGNLDAARDFSHVDDVVRAYALAAESDESGAAYNVCRGQAHCIRAAVDWLAAHARTPIDVEVDPARLRPIDVPEVRGAHDALTAATGWRPELPFEQILADLLAYWRAQPE